jgi:hypothetical protein
MSAARDAVTVQLNSHSIDQPPCLRDEAFIDTVNVAV